MEKQRDFSLDAIRAAAAVMVVGVHFFLNIGFYAQPMAGRTMAAAAMVRMCFMVCVPLFMMLTGRLWVERECGKGYYRKLLPVLVTFCLASGACLAFRILWLKEYISLEWAVRLFVKFDADPYGWYVRMYVGLFLLIPFLNAAWRGLDRDGRKRLVVTLVALTSLPTVTNLQMDLWADWWIQLYPVCYYVLGAWLGTYPLKVKGRWLALGWVGLAAATAFYRFWSAPGETFGWTNITGWYGLGVLGESVCAWSLLSRCTGEGWPGPVKRFVGWIAKLSLPLYLISYVTDGLLYPLLLERVTVFRDRLLWLPVMTAAVVLCSAVPAQVLDWMTRGIVRLLPAKRKSAAKAQGRE